MALVRNHRVNKNNKDAINRRLYKRLIVETAIYRVFFLTKSFLLLYLLCDRIYQWES
ncbi:hypothetical protein [Nostoc sp.]|uniref:hypothetical protein n=1 Tax=Nostoc sp. TaxID=1180 RepID=UPI002FFAA7F4